VTTTTNHYHCFYWKSTGENGWRLLL